MASAQRCNAVIKVANRGHGDVIPLLPWLQAPKDVTKTHGLYIIQTGQPTVTISLLHLLAYYGWLDTIKNTRHVFANNCRDSNGRTPLHYAAVTGRLEVIVYLIAELGCVPTDPDFDGDVPLHIACHYGHLNVTDYLCIEQNSDLRYKGSTLLHCASQNGHINIIQNLITRRGCNPVIVNSDGNLPIHIACLNGHLNTMKYFIAKQNVDPFTRGFNGFTCLHFASQGGHVDTIHYLINKVGFNPNIPDDKGSLPLHIACFCGHLGATKYFIIEQKCDPNIRDKQESTPLHYASQNGYMNIIQYLIEEVGCDPTTRNSHGSLPLHIVSLTGHLNATKYFIDEQKCDPTIRGQHGFTPLHCASQNGNMAIICYLIEEIGCDPKTQNSIGSLSLHIACYSGHINVVKYFITKQNCDPNCRGEHGQTPLHCACQGGHLQIVEYLISEFDCNPEISNTIGELPLHIACQEGHLNVTKYLINQTKCNPTCKNHNGSTPLHSASQRGQMNIIQYLVNEVGCIQISNKNGIFPIHLACCEGHINVAKYFITEQNCDPTILGQHKNTLLHCAAEGGHVSIIQYLITKLGCDPMTPNINGNLPLHNACLLGKLNVVKYFIIEQNFEPAIRGQLGSTPLHCATRGGHLDLIQYLIIEKGCDPSIVDDNGRTMLHWASYCGQIEIVKWLLCNGKGNLMAKDNENQSCIDLAGYETNRYELMKIFQPFVESTKSFPLHSFCKIILTGNSAAGKTTLAEVIAERATTYFNILRFGNVKQVVGKSAGIILSQIDSWEIGKIVLYDLAGQPEYHSSHLALMETVMQQSPATFINIVDLSKTDDEIIEQLHYWLNFINSITCKVTVKSCVIIVGSHADKLDKEQLKIKSTLIQELAETRIKQLEFAGIITLDCRRINSGATRTLISLLHTTCQAVSDRAPSMSYYCHLLYAFLQSKVTEQTSIFTLRHLISLIDYEDSSFIPAKASFLTELLVTLNDKGIVIFLKSKQELEKSWILLNTDTIMEKINGVLFAPKHFLKHKTIASNTGIVNSSSLEKLFPQYNLEMLVGFLEILQLCHRVDFSGILTNLQIETFCSDSDNFLLFFPCFLETSRPDVLPSNEDHDFGWCLCCREPDHQFFTSRFLHVLLLHLTLLTSEEHPVPLKNQRKCTVWTNGICWDNEEGITTSVELVDYNRRVVVLMSPKTDSRQIEYTKHRSSIIRLVLGLKQQFCPSIETTQYLISPVLLKNSVSETSYPPDKAMFSIKNVAKSMLLHKPYIVSCTEKTSEDFSTKDALKFEPYFLLSPSSVCELMEGEADDAVSHTLLHEAKTRCQSYHLQLQSYSNLRAYITEFSIFSNRDPIAIANLDRHAILDSTSEDLSRSFDLSLLPDAPINNSHMPNLLMILKPICDEWHNLGVYLGVDPTTLKTIELDQRGKVEDCKREMLLAWLRSTAEPCTKQQLMTALWYIAH